MPLAPPGVRAGREHLDRQLAVDQPAQRRRQPQPLVVEAAGVEADDELGRADAVGQRLDVGRQVGAAALLAGLDEHHEAGVGDALGLGRTRWPAGRRTRRSRRRRRRGRRACRPRCTGVHGPSPSRHPVISGCLSRWPYSSTVRSASVGSDAGTSHTIERRQAGQAVHVDGEPGDRAGRAPVDGQRRRPRSMWPLASQSSSKALETLGMGCTRSASGGRRRSHPASIAGSVGRRRVIRDACQTPAASARSASSTIWRDELAGRHQLVDGADALPARHELAAQVDGRARRGRRGG